MLVVRGLETEHKMRVLLQCSEVHISASLLQGVSIEIDSKELLSGQIERSVCVHYLCNDW